MFILIWYWYFTFAVIGIIKRKALIKDLAAVYHAECLKYCRELMELQRKWEEVRNLLNEINICFYCLFQIMTSVQLPIEEWKKGLLSHVHFLTFASSIL